MSFYKVTHDGYILGIGEGGGGTQISEAEYNEIMGVVKKKTFEKGIDYFLREDLTWEERVPEPPDPDEDIDGDDVLEILLGGAE